MAKRKMPEDEKRTHTVMVRFNDFEYSEISERAAESGLPVSTYVRQQAFYNDIVRHYNIIQDPKEIRKFVAEIGKIGSNLNQIARFFNTGGIRSLAMENDIHDCIAMLFNLRKRVLMMGGENYGSAQTPGQ